MPGKIVLGAGASYDCVALKTDSDEPDPSVTRVNAQYRPPLAKDLFSSGPAFDEILRKYPLATALSEEIRSRLRKSNEEGNATLPEILKEPQSSPSLDSRRQLHQYWDKNESHESPVLNCRSLQSDRNRGRISLSRNF
jgi:hypothetical protein